MLTLSELTTFLGWCTAINAVIFLVAAAATMTIGRWMSGLHGRMFGLEPAEVRRACWAHMDNDKIAILIFCLVPYIVLRALMSGQASNRAISSFNRSRCLRMFSSLKWSVGSTLVSAR